MVDTLTMPYNPLSKEQLETAFAHMATARALVNQYEANFKTVSKYVHATSQGHEAIQLAVGMQLTPVDYAFPYYRDDAMLLGMGLTPFELMLQLMAKGPDAFSGGRSYYCHPSVRADHLPHIPHQSSATGMQAIPAAGAALGLWYKAQMGLFSAAAQQTPPLVVCSLGDASVTEGEVSEALHMAALKQLPILFLVQDNGWDISATAAETRTADAATYAQGFVGLEAQRVDGTDFSACWAAVSAIFQTIRAERRPFLLHASVPLLHHHTSGVRKEWYRDDLDAHALRDPYPHLRTFLRKNGFSEAQLVDIEEAAKVRVLADYERAAAAPEPAVEDLEKHIFAPTPILAEQGARAPAGRAPKVMVDSALLGIEELMRAHPECLLYGQDVGRRLGGVFREAATLAEKFGDHRVFNTPIQEAFIIGSTVGMSAVGLKPIVEVQFADYIWPGLNQLFTEVSRSCYLTMGKWPVSCIIRVPIGAYGSGGPYHSSSVESIVANIRGVKIAYPSTGADLKGLLKAAYYDPNPVVIFEHKGLYWSKVAGTEGARTVEPDAAYCVPFGKSRMVLEADADRQARGEAVLVVTYGMGVYWAQQAAMALPQVVSVLDLRTLHPLDTAAVYAAAKAHGRVLVLTEEAVDNSFAQSLAARIGEHCFEQLDAPVRTLGAANIPAIPLNEGLERAALPSVEKVTAALRALLAY